MIKSQQDILYASEGGTWWAGCSLCPEPRRTGRGRGGHSHQVGHAWGLGVSRGDGTEVPFPTPPK